MHMQIILYILSWAWHFALIFPSFSKYNWAYNKYRYNKIIKVSNGGKVQDTGNEMGAQYMG